MSFLDSIQNQSKKHDFPFDHWEYNNALTDEAINEIVKADIPDVSKHNINYAKEFFGDNHTVIMDVDKKAYLSALAIAENIIVTCDSSSMISEAALTRKPIYIANISPKKNDKRFQRFRNLFRELNITRNLDEKIENWNYQKLDETNRVANIIKQKFIF